MDFKMAYIRRFNEMASHANAQPVTQPQDILNDPIALRGALLGYTEKVIELEHKVDRVIEGSKVLRIVDSKAPAIMVRQILGAVSQFEKASLGEKLRKARERKRMETGRCEGRKPVPNIVIKEAKRLYRKSPRTGKRRNLRVIAKELADLGHHSVSGKPYGAESVKQMVVG